MITKVRYCMRVSEIAYIYPKLQTFSLGQLSALCN